MSSRTARHFVPLVVAAVVACDSATDATNINRSLSASLHGSPGSCVDGITWVEVSTYPNTVAVGDTSHAYASNRNDSGDYLSTAGIRWSVADTSIAAITAADEMGRPIVTGRSNGTTQIVVDCGYIAGAATLTVSGGSDTNRNAGAVVVTLADSSLRPGETTQAEVHMAGATGHTVSIADAKWATSTGAVASVSPSGVVTAVGEGVAVISAAVSGKVAGASLSVETTPTPPPSSPPPVSDPSGVTAVPPALPLSVPDFGAIPGESRQIRVAAGGDLQAALDNAQLGDAILLAPGATYTGNFTLRDKGGRTGCPAWITIRTDASLPAPGQRVTPALAANFAKVYTPDVQPAIRTEPRASCYRIMGLEVALPTWLSSFNYGIVWLGDGGYVPDGEKQTSLDLVATNIVLDRLYIHGQTNSILSRCVALNSGNTAIIDSWISECHAVDTDAQAIAGWNGPGPYLIENNFLAGSGENIIFGGANANIVNLVPSDITIRRNHFYKDPAWKGRWLVKNLFELKSSRRTLVEGNVFENNWADGQTGMAIVIKSTNPGGGSWQGTTDLTFRYNIVRNSSGGISIAANPDVEYRSQVVPVSRVKVEHNLLDNIGRFNGADYRRPLILMNALTDVAVEHNTMVLNASGLMLTLDVMPLRGARNIVVNDNISTNNNEYAIHHADQQVGSASFSAFAGTAWAFNRNVVLGVDPQYAPWHPQASWYPLSLGAVGFVNPSGGDYRLSSASPYKGRGLGGTDPGADIDELNRRTAGVTSGAQGSFSAARLFR